MRVGGCVRPHATRSRVDSRAPPHAVRAIARGAWAPARRVDAPLRCGVPQGPHHLVRWCGGVVRRGVSVVQSRRALAHLSRRRREIRRSGALDGLVAQGLRLARTHCAHPLARRPRVLVARQHAVSEPTSLTCVHGRGRGRGCRITRLGRHTERVLSSCTLGRGVLAEGGMSGRIPHGRWRAGGGLGAVLGARRGVGGDSPGAVAVSLAREDHTTTPRWRPRRRRPCPLPVPSGAPKKNYARSCTALGGDHEDPPSGFSFVPAPMSSLENQKGGGHRRLLRCRRFPYSS